MRIALTLISIVIGLTLSAQITFQKWYGTNVDMEYSLSGVPVSSGGYAIAMNTDSSPTTMMDIVLLRTDANGNELWRKYFGSSGWDIATGVIETSDGGFALCGSWNGFGSDSAVVIKTDANGNQQWQYVFLPSPGRAVAQDLIQLSDGSIIVCGFTGQSASPDGFITKFTSAGSLVWQKIHGGASKDEYLALEEVNGTGFILAGQTESYSPSRDFWVVRTDANGDTLWTRNPGTSVQEEAYDVVCTQDGGFAIFGYEYISGGDAILVKLNASGAQQWLQNYDGGGWESGYSLVETWDGGFALAGRKENPANNSHMWLIRTDNLGAFLWDRTYPSAYLSDGYDIHATSDGGFLIVGADLNMSGDPGQAYVVKTENAGWVSVAENTSVNEIIFAQNFSDQTITFSFMDAIPGRRVRVVNAEGKLVFDGEANDQSLIISTAEFATGVYVYSVYANNQLLTAGKFVRY